MRYKVSSPKRVIEDMARYDNAEIIEMVEVDSEYTRKVKERFADEPDQIDQFINYDAVLESDQCTLPRWFSFGVYPVMLENNDE